MPKFKTQNLKPKLHRFTKAAPSQTAEQRTIVNPNLKTIGSTRSGLVDHSGSDSENSSLLSNSISLSFWISLFLAIIGLDLLGIHSCDWVSIVSFNIFVSYLSCLQNMASTTICICCRQRQPFSIYPLAFSKFIHTTMYKNQHLIYNSKLQ